MATGVGEQSRANNRALTKRQEGFTMSDQDLSKLERETRLNPDNLELRSKLYSTLIRFGRASEDALSMAASFGDPAAMAITGDGTSSRSCQNNNLAVVKELPVQSLDLGNCRFLTNVGLEHLANLPLRRLRIGYSDKISNKGLQFLKDCPLRSLEIDQCVKITDAGLKHLRRMPLQELKLVRCRGISGKGFKHFNDLPLQSLELYSCAELTGETVKHLRGLPLQRLKINHCSVIDIKAFEYLKELPLESLDFWLCAGVNDEVLKEIKKLSLKSLSIDMCSISDKGLKFLKNLPLTKLRLVRSDISGRGLKQIAKMSIEDLSLNGCDRVTDNSLKQLRDLPLSNLNLSHCESISDRGLQELLSLPLETLHLRGCENISRKGIESLKALPLKRLYLGRNSKTEDALNTLQSLNIEVGMTTDQFWSLLEEHVEISECGGVDPVNLERHLKTLQPDDIVDFAELMSIFYSRSYTWKLWGAAFLILGGASDDSFDYFRSWLIGHGKDRYYRAIENPDSLVDFATDSAADEEVYSVADRAYEAITGSDIDYRIEPLADLGQEWDFGDQTEMRTRYPRLFAKFASDWS